MKAEFYNGLQECLAGAPWGMLWDWLQEQHYHVATPEWQFTWLVGRYGLRPEMGCPGYGWFMHPMAGNTSSVCVRPLTVYCETCSEIWGKQDKTPADAYQRLYDNMYSHTCGWLEWLEETKGINPAVPRPLAPDSFGWYHARANKKHKRIIDIDPKACKPCLALMANTNASYPELWEWAASNDHNHDHLEELYAIHHGELQALDNLLNQSIDQTQPHS